jgi:diguanylate cyclase (GGDEF)-like protein
VRVSAGIAAEAGTAAVLRELLRRADTALYEAKRTGRDRVVALDSYATAERVPQPAG